VTSTDSKLIDDFCQTNKISPLNTRLFKSEDGKVFELMIASAENNAEKMPYLKSYELEGGIVVHVTAGDFAPFMKELVSHMEEARKHVVDENQGKMIDNYIEHFTFGE
jgi:dipeptidyl-peptidase-3